MNKRVVTGSSVGTYWIWEMPEVAKRIPELFAEAGKARITSVGMSREIVNIEVVLKVPARVVDWSQSAGDGLAINSDTFAIFSRIPSATIHKLPKNGDKKISFSIWLELHTFEAEDAVTTTDLENELRQMATAMTKTWYYNFK